MDNFDLKKYLAEGKLLKETPEEEFEDSISKDVPSFRADLAKDISDKDILNVIKKGMGDGDENDDKLPYNDTDIIAIKLFPTQNEIGFDQSIEGVLTDEYNSLQGIIDGNPDLGPNRIITYEGKWIIDGHHRWSSAFAVNPQASLKVHDIAKKPGFEPKDILKAVHTSIAIDRGKVPSSDPEGDNILTKLSLDDIKKKVKEKLNDKARNIWYKNFDYDNDDQIANHLYKNLSTMISREPKHLPGAPGRKDMPQTDADKTPSKDKLDPLSKGEINITKPFENRIKLIPLLKETINKK
jgi:hypothetical protein